MGVVKFLAYRMSLFLISENKELSPSEAIERSQKMMYGYKVQLFKLEIAFLALTLPEFILSIVIQVHEFEK